MNAFNENRVLVATPTALFAGSVGLSRWTRTHGSRSALTVATTAIFIRDGGPEKLKEHFHEHVDYFWHFSWMT